MIYDRENIQISELCPLQFTEPREYEFYKQQLYYVPKLVTLNNKVQVLLSEYLYDYLISNEYTLNLVGFDSENNEVLTYLFELKELSTGYFYAIANINTFNGVYDSCVYFEIRYLDGSEYVVLADSLWYIIDPIFKKDIKAIKYKHSENDWNTIFVDGITEYEYILNVECGFIPKDGRDEQEAEDFIEQDMVNDTVYGDEYEVLPLTIGGSIGIPNWLRKKISRATLCDTFKIGNSEYKRINGSKMEKIEDSENGLATYRIDLQTTNNYLQ